MQILVTGGAGYIGSHMVKLLNLAGYEVIVLDDLSSGSRKALIYANKFINGSIADKDLLTTLFSIYDFAAVFHFASHIQVAESVKDPAKYYFNNVSATLNLLEAMRCARVTNFIFSSTAAIYGSPLYTPIDENHPKAPINPYGYTKLVIEQVLKDFHYAYGFNSVCLRYFNAAGADPDGQLGERHDPETHLIPLVLQAAAGRIKSISIFGTDYDTTDGTCIRDYIHVSDLCDAHLLGLEYLLSGGKSINLNLGNGNGFSVKEVIDTARKVTGHDIAVLLQSRRPGDPSKLVANSIQAKNILGWQPRRSNLETIIQDAWAWELNNSWKSL